MVVEEIMLQYNMYQIQMCLFQRSQSVKLQHVILYNAMHTQTLQVGYFR